MTFLCDNCQYIEECKPHKDNLQSIGCCDFGLFDEDGLIEDWDRQKGGADMRKPNCVTCDHFGKCEGCEKGEEE